MFAGVQMVVAPEYAGFVFGTELVIWVALGGRGTLIGPVIGTLLIDVSTAYLSGDLPFIWKLIIGLAFVVVIVALPQGIAPLVKSLFRFGPRARGEPEAPVLQPAREEPFAGLAEGGTHAIAVREVRKRFGSLVANPDLWIAALLRARAESMTWTPGLVLDYARALHAVVERRRRPWRRRLQAARRQRRHRRPPVTQAA